jgi:hypothetical protein
MGSKNLVRPADFADSAAGLPDFSWYKIPEQEKYTKLPLNTPNVH